MDHPLTLLYCPFPTIDAARAAATALLEARVVACCNLLPSIESLYWWEDKLATNPETILIAKTTAASIETARHMMLQYHPYDCPAILSWSADANGDFARWATAQLADA